MATSVPLNMKADLQVRSLFDRAARISLCNRTEFVLQAAIQRAQEVILEYAFTPPQKKAWRVLDGIAP